jgi:hypothetical protein
MERCILDFDETPVVNGQLEEPIGDGFKRAMSDVRSQ